MILGTHCYLVLCVDLDLGLQLMQLRPTVVGTLPPSAYDFSVATAGSSGRLRAGWKFIMELVLDGSRRHRRQAARHFRAYLGLDGAACGRALE